MEKNDQAFDQEFKRILENPPPLFPSEGALQAMYERLEKEGTAPSAGLFMWPRSLYLALLMLPLLAGLLYLFFEVQHAKRHIHELNLLLTQATQTTDTLTHTIYRYDTIVEVIYLRKQLVGLSPTGYYSSAGTSFPSLRGITGVGGSTARPYPAVSRQGIRLNPFLPAQKRLLAHLAGAQPTANAGRPEADPALPPAMPVAISPLLTPPFSLRTSLLQHRPEAGLKPLPDLPGPKKRLYVSQLLRPMKPDGFEAGLFFDPYSILVPSSRRGISGGLSANFRYGQHLRLRTGAELFYLHYEEKSPTNMALFPPGTPRDVEDRLKEIYVTYYLLEIPIGMDYYFFPHSKWQAFGGAAWLLRKPLGRKLGYEYSGQVEEYKIDRQLGAAPFSFNQLRLRAGLQYTLYQHVRLRLGLQYSLDAQTNPHTFIPLDRLALQLGVGYGF
ncbi:MAG: hypothetical protein D6730_10880 [Bacteroidetes bacterium]|nr:MAG: hypothetical protein D6730_10880 [Bacteroidota bacterium]